MDNKSGDVVYNDRAERMIFGGAIIGANLLAMVGMAFVEIPPENATIFGQIAGGMSAALGIIVAATWKTNANERQQAQTINKLVEKAPPSTVPQEELTYGPERNPGRPAPEVGGVGELGGASRTADQLRPGAITPVESDAAAAAYGTAKPS